MRFGKWTGSYEQLLRFHPELRDRIFAAYGKWCASTGIELELTSTDESLAAFVNGIFDEPQQASATEQRNVPSVDRASAGELESPVKCDTHSYKLPEPEVGSSIDLENGAMLSAFKATGFTADIHSGEVTKLRSDLPEPAVNRSVRLDTRLVSHLQHIMAPSANTTFTTSSPPARDESTVQPLSQTSTLPTSTKSPTTSSAPSNSLAPAPATHLGVSQGGILHMSAAQPHPALAPHGNSMRFQFKYPTSSLCTQVSIVGGEDDWQTAERNMVHYSQRLFNAITAPYDRNPNQTPLNDKHKALNIVKQSKVLAELTAALSNAGTRVQTQRYCDQAIFNVVQTHKVGIPTEIYDQWKNDKKKPASRFDHTLICSARADALIKAITDNKRLGTDITKSVNLQRLARDPKIMVKERLQGLKSNKNRGKKKKELERLKERLRQGPAQAPAPGSKRKRNTVPHLDSEDDYDNDDVSASATLASTDRPTRKQAKSTQHPQMNGLAGGQMLPFDFHQPTLRTPAQMGINENRAAAGYTTGGYGKDPVDGAATPRHPGGYGPY